MLFITIYRLLITVKLGISKLATYISVSATMVKWLWYIQMTQLEL